MPKDIYETLLHPIRVRIMQSLILGEREQVTANEICGLLSDVPRTTIYRHINVLIGANILHVVAERKVRGSVERTLSLNVSEFEKLNQAEDIPGQIFQFMMLTYAKFERYFSKKSCKSIASVTDPMFFTNTVLMLNDQEWETFAVELGALIQKHHFQDTGDGRKPRDISIILAPPEPEKD